MNKKVILVITVIFLLTSYRGFTKFTEAKENPQQHSIKFINITIEPGDTVWSIAEEHKGDIEHQTFIAMIQQINNMEHTVVREGSTLKVPVF